MTRCLQIGGAGDSPAPVGDPPSGTAESKLRPSALARTVAPIPSGESPDGTGGSPVLPKTIFQTRSKGLCKNKIGLSGGILTTGHPAFEARQIRSPKFKIRKCPEAQTGARLPGLAIL